MFLFIRKSYNLKRIVVRESPWYKIQQVNNKVETFMSKHMCPKKSTCTNTSGIMCLMYCDLRFNSFLIYSLKLNAQFDHVQCRTFCERIFIQLCTSSCIRCTKSRIRCMRFHANFSDAIQIITEQDKSINTNVLQRFVHYFLRPLDCYSTFLI